MSDPIDRQAAIDAVVGWFCDLLGVEEISEDLGCLVRLRELPSAQPERKTGRWIHDGYDLPHGVDWMHCSNCGRREPYVPAAMTAYCPSCGAKMEVEHETD